MTPWDPDHYRALVEHSPAMMWTSDSDGNRDCFNETWRAFTGLSTPQSWHEAVHPDDREECLSKYRDSVARRESFAIEYRLRRQDGLYRYVIDRGAPCVDVDGNVRGFVGSCLDLDERHAREAFSANEFFEMALDHLCVTGFDGWFRRVTPSWSRTLGWSIEELLSRPSEEFVHPEDRHATLAGRQRLHDGKALGPLQNRYLCKDGSYRWFEWRSVAHPDRRLVYAAARDITEQKNAEARLHEARELQEKLERQLLVADRMASVGTLAAGVAHEINNPLSYVMANVALLCEQLPTIAEGWTPEQLNEAVEIAREALQGADRIRKIVRGLKTFSRAEQERPAVVDVHRVLDLAVDMTFNEIKHRARLVKQYGAMPTVHVDEARLGQVFINLLVNAAQALPDGKSATNEIRIATSTDAEGRAVVEIRDTGMGIAPSDYGRIFDPFYTTKPIGVGTGLGLSICHNIVTALGGAISFASEVGHGTTFRVVLPAATATAPARAATAPSPAATRVRARVLVVDDELQIGVALRRVLREHDVTAVTTAKEALDLLDAGRRFDVVFSDLMMPEMSGMDFHEALARRFPETAARVVFVSGGAFTPGAKAFLDRVTNERLAKPFDADTVRALVQRYAVPVDGHA